MTARRAGLAAITIVMVVYLRGAEAEQPGEHEPRRDLLAMSADEIEHVIFSSLMTSRDPAGCDTREGDLSLSCRGSFERALEGFLEDARIGVDEHCVAELGKTSHEVRRHLDEARSRQHVNASKIVAMFA